MARIWIATPSGLVLPLIRGGSGGGMFTPDWTAWRYYNDGTETGATPKEDQDVNHTLDISGGDTQIQIRVLIEETGGADGAAEDDYSLQYQVNGSGGWTEATGTSGRIQADSGSALTNGDPTTDRTTGITNPGSGSFIAGGQEASNGVIEDRHLLSGDFMEHVWGYIVIAAANLDGDFLDFRMSLNGGNPGMASTVVPRLTFDKPVAGGVINIPFTMGQDVLDEEKLDGADSKFFPFPHRIFPGRDIIPLLTGQWLGDEEPAIDAPPQFLPSIIPGVEVAAPASPVIPFTHGQWLGDREAEIDSAPFYFEFPYLDKLLFPAYPVIPMTVGQIIEPVPEIDAPPQFLPVMVQLIAAPVVQNNIPYVIGQWLGETDDTYSQGSRFSSGGVVLPARPVIPFSIGQWLGDEDPDIDSFPQYLAVMVQPPPPVPSNIVFIKGQWLGEEDEPIDSPPFYFAFPHHIFPGRPINVVTTTMNFSQWVDPDAWTSASKPTKIGGPDVVPFAVIYNQYRARARVNTRLFGRVDFIFEADVHDGRIRLFNETTGLVVQGSYLQNWNTAYTSVPLSVRVVLEEGDNRYRVEMGSTSGRTVAVDNARLYPEAKVAR